MGLVHGDASRETRRSPSVLRGQVRALLSRIVRDAFAAGDEGGAS